MIPPWTKGACRLCGDEGYVTRSRSAPDGTEYTCAYCEGFEDGLGSSSELDIHAGSARLGATVQTFALEALSRYGHEAQLGMVREELPELLTALARRDRGRATDADVIDECADALIVLWQLRHMLGAVQVDEVVQRKIARQRARMGEP